MPFAIVTKNSAVSGRYAAAASSAGVSVKAKSARSGPARGRTSGLLAVGALGLLACTGALPAAAQLAGPGQPSAKAPVAGAPLSFADIVERVKPAVVSISVTNGGRVARNQRGTPQPGTPGAPGTPRGGRPFEGLPQLPEDHPLNEFFRNLPREFGGGGGGGGGATPTPRPSMAQGSGFVISPDGYVVTNNHVIDGATKITVTFDGDEKHEADLIGKDPRTDLALLKIKANKSFAHVKFATKQARVGDWVVAVGNPFGLGGTVTAGIVSAQARDIGSGPYDFMQIDAAVNRGNSGGPTFNLEGEVVGVNTAIYSPSGGNVGIAFAVPAQTATRVVEQLKVSGTVQRGWLGVKIQNIDEDTAASLGLPEPKGALVSEVTPNGPAAASGLKAQDAIVQVNGDKINDSRDLARKVAEYSPETAVDVRVWRNGAMQTVKVKLGKFPGSSDEIARLEQGKPAGTELDQLGLTLAPVASGAKKEPGVAISDVAAGSDAVQKGVKAGDVILEIGGTPVATADDVVAGIKKAKELGRKAVLLNIKSGEAKRFVAIQLKDGTPADGNKKG